VVPIAYVALHPWTFLGIFLVLQTTCPCRSQGHQRAKGRGEEDTHKEVKGEGQRGAKDGWSETTAKAIYFLPT